MGTMERILRLMGEKKASDVYMSAASPVLIKINGVCTPMNAQPLPVDGPLQLLAEIITTAASPEVHSQDPAVDAIWVSRRSDPHDVLATAFENHEDAYASECQMD